MTINIGKPNISVKNVLSKVSDFDLIHYYFGINEVPCIINSPLREDKHPSFGFYSSDGIKIHYKDLATNESNGIFDLLSKYWGLSIGDTLFRVWKDIPNITNVSSHITKSEHIFRHGNYSADTDLKCKIREWKDYDIEYWKSYGITLKWLKYANVYPISHKIVIKGDKRYVFPADKYAYAYVEFKEGKTTLKIYQPYNTKGYKWSNRHDSSVISLWTKVPETGDKICICSSLKDALCLSANTKIPAIAPQGEGYNMSDTAVKELKRRFNKVYILFDNDEAGLIDGQKLSESTGFINLVLPSEYGEKDISDLYHSLQDKDKFNKIILKLFEL